MILWVRKWKCNASTIMVFNNTFNTFTWTVLVRKLMVNKQRWHTDTVLSSSSSHYSFLIPFHISQLFLPTAVCLPIFPPIHQSNEIWNQNRMLSQKPAELVTEGKPRSDYSGECVSLRLPTCHCTDCIMYNKHCITMYNKHFSFVEKKNYTELVVFVHVKVDSGLWNNDTQSAKENMILDLAISCHIHPQIIPLVSLARTTCIPSARVLHILALLL